MALGSATLLFPFPHFLSVPTAAATACPMPCACRPRGHICPLRVRASLPPFVFLYPHNNVRACPPGSGKTTLLNVLSMGEPLETVPTIGLNVKRVKRGGVNMKCWCVQGPAQGRP